MSSQRTNSRRTSSWALVKKLQHLLSPLFFIVALAFACCVFTFSLQSLCLHPGLLFAIALISNGACTLFCKALMPFSIISSSLPAVNCSLRLFLFKEKDWGWKLACSFNETGTSTELLWESLGDWECNWFWSTVSSPVDCSLGRCLLVSPSLDPKRRFDTEAVLPSFTTKELFLDVLKASRLIDTGFSVIAGYTLLLGLSLKRCTPLSRNGPGVGNNQGLFPLLECDVTTTKSKQETI